jgi:hypothetical protein
VFLRIEIEPRRLFAPGRPLTRFPWVDMGPERAAVEAVAGIQDEHVDPLAVRFQAAMPPDAPLPMTITGYTFEGVMICMRILRSGRSGSMPQTDRPDKCRLFPRTAWNTT